MRLTDILKLVNTSQTIKITNEYSGEKFYPSYHGINEYSDAAVLEIRSKDNNLEIVINPPPF